MSREDRQPSRPLVRVVVGVLLATPFVVYLWVPSYSRIEPRLGGFPFFYWWQLLWVVLTGVFIWIAVLLTGPDREPGDDETGGETARAASEER